MINNVKKYKVIPVLLILFYILVYILVSSTLTAAEESVPAQGSIISGFMDECSNGIRLNQEWTKTYSNGFDTRIKVAMTKNCLDEGGYQINRTKYNSDLTENDIAIVYSKCTRNVNILYGKNIDKKKIEIYDYFFKNSFNKGPCEGFEQFINKTSKESVIIGSTGSTTSGGTTNNTTKGFDCAEELSKAQKNSKMYQAGSIFGRIVITAYDSIYYSCRSTIYGARAALLLAEYVSTYDLNKAEQWYLKAYLESEGFPEIAREGLYNYIRLYSISGDCEVVTKYLVSYKERFTGQVVGYDTKLDEIEKRCSKVLEQRSKCVQLYSSASQGRKINIVFIADEYTDINKFVDDVSNIVDKGLFYDDFMKSFREKFTIYYIETLSNGICQEDKYDKLDYPCDYGKMQDALKPCSGGRAVVLSQQEFRSYADYNGNAYISVKMESLYYEWVTRHELGHSIFNLADEYVEEVRGDRSRAPNCFDDEKKAKKYWEEYLSLKEGEDFNYFQGCAYMKSNTRGTVDSVMRNPRDCPYFGTINEAHIRQFMINYR
jgi:hypothetical protein